MACRSGFRSVGWKKVVVYEVGVLLGFTWSAFCWAEPIGYWRFEDGQAGTTPTGVASIYNSSSMQGTVYRNPILSSDVPGFWISEGIGGTIRPNATSIYFDFVPAGDSGYPVQDGADYIAIPYNSLLEPSAFTIEFFMKAPTQSKWPGIVVKPKTPDSYNENTTIAGYLSWEIGKQNKEYIFARIDPPHPGNPNVNFAGTTATADGRWHHFALTYSPDSGGTWTLYLDYTQAAQQTGVSIDYQGQYGLYFAYAPVVNWDNTNQYPSKKEGWPYYPAYPYRGWLDEVRFSDRVLTPAEFLQIVPEPASGLLALLALGGLGLWSWLRRR